MYDKVTGLYYYNARFYDPEDGRFLAQDTYRGEKEKTETWHLYTYCANNPVNYVDPTGHFVWVLPGLVIGGFVTIVVKVAATIVIGRITYTIAAKAYENIKKKKQKQKYYYKAEYRNGHVYIAYKKGKISRKSAGNRIRGKKSVYTFLRSNAKKAMTSAGQGRTKAEIHLKKGSVSFRHYHTKRRNGAHMWFGPPYTR